MLMSSGPWLPKPHYNLSALAFVPWRQYASQCVLPHCLWKPACSPTDADPLFVYCLMIFIHSLALAKQIVNGNHMCTGYHTPTHASLWFITLHFLAYKAAKHLVVTSAPFWFEVLLLPRHLKGLRTKNDTGSKPAHAGIGLESCHKTSREQLSATRIYKLQSV